MIRTIETEEQLEFNLSHVEHLLNIALHFESNDDLDSRDRYLLAAVNHMKLIEEDMSL